MASTFDTVRQLARALPAVEEDAGNGPQALRVKGKLLAWIRDAPDVLAVKVNPIARDYMLRGEPEIFFVTDHYRDYPIVLVRLARIERRRLAEVLEEGWRQVAPKGLLARYDAKDGPDAKRRGT